MTDKQLTIKPWTWVSGGYCLADPDGASAVTVSPNVIGFDLDPEALRDWIESQRPKLLYRVKKLGLGTQPWEWAVIDTADSFAIARFGSEDTAQEYADMCNGTSERETQ